MPEQDHVGGVAAGADLSLSLSSFDFCTASHCPILWAMGVGS